MSDYVRAAVIGAGSWGTAYGKVLADAGCEVVLCARRPAIAAAISETRENAGYLPGVRLPERLSATSDDNEALDGADLVVFAVPAQTMRKNLVTLAGRMPSDATLVSLAKGVELGTHKRMTEVIREVTGIGPGRVAVVSGPNLAREIAMEQPAATVVACTDLARSELLQRSSTTGYLRAYTNADVIGCELGGAVKNVIALACGMAEGMGFGDNTKASLMTRGLAETTRLGIAMGADPLTFAGLAGLGDLAATCFSPLSRNRTFGERLGRGDTMEQAVEHSSQTAEGVKSCLSILELAATAGVDMPITQEVVNVCHDGLSPKVAMSRLMRREPKAERTL